MKYTLVWDIPGIWRGLEKLKPLKEQILEESLSFKGKTEKHVTEFARNYLRMPEVLIQTNLRKLNKFIYLLFLGEDYGNTHHFWKKLPLPTLEEKFFQSFIQVIKTLNLFLPKRVPGNRKVNLILLHVLIPPKAARKFLTTANFIYKKLNSNESRLEEISKEELAKLINSSPQKLKSFTYACQFNETFSRFKEILKEYFLFVKGEISYPELPDWLIKEMTKDEMKKEGKSINFKKLLKGNDFVFLNWKKKKIKSFVEEDILILAEEPSYLLVSEEFFQKEEFPFFLLLKEKDEGYKLLQLLEPIRDFETFQIGDFLIEIQEPEKLIEIEGEKVELLAPIEGSGKVFSGIFSIKPSSRVKELLIKGPEGEFTLDELPPLFKTPGHYEILYRDRRTTIQRLYLLPETPRLLSELEISYKGKKYQPGDIIKERFGKFIVLYEPVWKLLRGERKIFYEKERQLILPPFPKGLKGYLFNRCGQRLISTTGGEEISLSEFTKNELIFPLIFLFYYKGKKVGSVKIGKSSRRKKCPLAKVIELAVNKQFRALKKVKVEKEIEEELLTQGEKEAIKEFFSQYYENPTIQNFANYLENRIALLIEGSDEDRSKCTKTLYQIKKNLYLRRLANKLIKLEV